MLANQILSGLTMLSHGCLSQSRTEQKGEPMALNNLEDRLECAIRHINTALDIDPWAQNLAVESMRMRIALMKGGQPEIVNCRDCKHWLHEHLCIELSKYGTIETLPCEHCSRAERRTDDLQ